MEEIINYVVALCPSLAAIATVIVAGIKVVKSLKDKTSALTKDIDEKVKAQGENIVKVVNTNEAVLNSVNSLKKVYTELLTNLTAISAQLAENKELKAQLDQAIAKVGELETTLTTAVKEQYIEARRNIRQLKRDSDVR